jgi:hypothetical protein
MMCSKRINRYEVISPTGYNVLGYIWARDINHAFRQAAERYNCKFLLWGA